MEYHPELVVRDSVGPLKTKDDLRSQHGLNLALKRATITGESDSVVTV